MREYIVCAWEPPCYFREIFATPSRPDVETLILGMLKDGTDFAVEIDDDEKGD